MAMGTLNIFEVFPDHSGLIRTPCSLIFKVLQFFSLTKFYFLVRCSCVFLL